MDFLPKECAVNSVGASNNLFGILISTLVAAQCALSPADRWPSDYGPQALTKGKHVELSFKVVKVMPPLQILWITILLSSVLDQLEVSSQTV